jgi:hypothetical protein
MTTMEALQMIKENPSLKFMRFFKPDEMAEEVKDAYCILFAIVLCDGAICIDVRRWDGHQVSLVLNENDWEITERDIP